MASANVHEFSDGSFDQDVIQSDQPVLVDFWAEWCSPCKRLAPFIDEVADEFAGQAKVGKLDIESNKDTPTKFEISAIPTVMLFKGGEVVKKFIGLTSKEELAAAVAEAVGSEAASS
ncbi:MAG: thioredoxin [Planctomycetota bacterium]